MPFIPNTPEQHTALTNPASPAICRGISNDGKPCKRTLIRSTSGNPPSGIITIVGKQEAFFCNRHQDQAKDVVLRHTASFSRRRALVGRGSLDTLIEKVEVLVGGEDDGKTISTTVVSTTKKVSRDKDPFRVIEEEDEDLSTKGSTPRPPTPPLGYNPRRRQSKPKRSGLQRFMSKFFCCFVEEDINRKPDEGRHWSEKRREAELRSAAAGVVDNNFPQPPARAARGKRNNRVGFESVPPTPPLPMMAPKRKAAPTALRKPEPAPTIAGTSRGHGQSPATVTPQSSPSEEDDLPAIDTGKLSAQEKRMLSIIPRHLSPKIITQLQRELLKPFSDKDEAGYIYMFWLTDSPLSPPSTSAPTPTSNANSLVRTTIRARPSPGGTKPTILFKIGRAVNVQRRLHQWTTQCGYNLSLIRYYPHTSATYSPGASLGRKVPHVNRVERLIHLELADRNPKRFCDACGKTHKEWFEVDATREGVLAVDEVIKRWVEWSEATIGIVHKKPPQRPSPPKRAEATTKHAGGVRMYDTKPRSVSSGSRPTSRTHEPKPRSTSSGSRSTSRTYEPKPRSASSGSKPTTTKTGPKRKSRPSADAKSSPSSKSKTEMKQNRSRPAYQGSGNSRHGRRKMADGDDDDDDDAWGEEDYTPSD